MTFDGLLSAAVTLFFVMDPLGNIPVFTVMLARYPPQQRSRIIARELGIALVILLVFLLAGNHIMAFLGLTQPSLSLGGGILLFIIALRMIFPSAAGSSVEVDLEPFIVPLATPLIAGPSTLAMLMLLASSSPERLGEWVGAVGIAWLATTIILAASPLLLRVVGARGLRAMERLMGMLLVLMAIQMLLNGMAAFIQQVVVSMLKQSQ